MGGCAAGFPGLTAQGTRPTAQRRLCDTLPADRRLNVADRRRRLRDSLRAHPDVSEDRQRHDGCGIRPERQLAQGHAACAAFSGSRDFLRGPSTLGANITRPRRDSGRPRGSCADRIASGHAPARPGSARLVPRVEDASNAAGELDRGTTARPHCFAEVTATRSQRSARRISGCARCPPYAALMTGAIAATPSIDRVADHRSILSPFSTACASTIGERQLRARTARPTYHGAHRARPPAPRRHMLDGRGRRTPNPRPASSRNTRARCSLRPARSAISSAEGRTRSEEASHGGNYTRVLRVGNVQGRG